MSDIWRPQGPEPTRLLCLWDSPGKNTGAHCHFLLQGIVPTQGQNPCPRCWQADSSPLGHKGSPKLTGILTLFFHISFQKSSETAPVLRPFPSAIQTLKLSEKKAEGNKKNLTLLQKASSRLRNAHLDTQCRVLTPRTGKDALVMTMPI